MSHVAASAPVTARVAPRAPLATRHRHHRAPGALAPHRVSSKSIEKSRAVFDEADVEFLELERELERA